MAKQILRADENWKLLISPSTQASFMCNISGTTVQVFLTTTALTNLSTQIAHPYALGGSIYQIRSKPEEYVYVKAYPTEAEKNASVDTSGNPIAFTCPIIIADKSIPKLEIDELVEANAVLHQELGRAMLRITDLELAKVSHDETFRRTQREFMENEIKTDTSIAKLYAAMFKLNTRLFGTERFIREHKRLHTTIDSHLDVIKNLTGVTDDIDTLNTNVNTLMTEMSAIIDKVNDLHDNTKADVELLVANDVKRNAFDARLENQLLHLHSRLFSAELYLISLKTKLPQIEQTIAVNNTDLSENITTNAVDIININANVSSIINRLASVEQQLTSDGTADAQRITTLESEITTINKDFDDLNDMIVSFADNNTIAEINETFSTLMPTVNAEMQQPLIALKNVILRIKHLELGE